MIAEKFSNQFSAFVGVLTFSAGWAWLGLHLALGRPLAPRPAS